MFLDQPAVVCDVRTDLGARSERGFAQRLEERLFDIDGHEAFLGSPSTDCRYVLEFCINNFCTHRAGSGSFSLAFSAVFPLHSSHLPLLFSLLSVIRESYLRNLLGYGFLRAQITVVLWA